MKRIMSFILASLTLTALACPVAFAKEETTMPNANSPIVAPLPEVTSKYVVINGTVKEADAKHVLVEKADGSGEIILNVDKNTLVVDNNTKKPVALKDLKAGSELYAWHSKATTRSLPPQSYAYAMTVNVKENTTVGRFFEVEGALKNKDGSYRLLNEAQDLWLTIPKDTRITIFGTNDTKTPGFIKPGTKLMAWFDVVALSFPGQATSDTVIAFPYDYDGYISVSNGAVQVNGTKLGQKSVENGGAVMVPVMQVARKLGFGVSYDKKTQIVTLKGEKGNATFVVGQDTFTVYGDEVGTKAPIATNGTVYVELAAFAHLGNYKLANPVR